MTAVSALLASSEFAHLALQHVEVAHPDAHLALDGDAFALRWSRGSHAGLLTLGNHYAEYIDSPHALNAVLARIAGNLNVVEMSDELGAVQSMVMPRVRTRHHFDVELPRLIAQLTVSQPEAKPRMLDFTAINAHLGWCVALDMPAHIRETDAHQLDTERASLEALAMELGTTAGDSGPELYIMPPPDRFEWLRLESTALSRSEPAAIANAIPRSKATTPLTAHERKSARPIAIVIVLLVAFVAACEYMRHH